MKRYLVLNKTRSEGAMFDDMEDAKQAAGRKKLGAVHSCLAADFRESYYDDRTKLQIIDIDIPGA